MCVYVYMCVCNVYVCMCLPYSSQEDDHKGLRGVCCPGFLGKPNSVFLERTLTSLFVNHYLTPARNPITTCVYAYMRVCMYVCVCVYVCVCATQTYIHYPDTQPHRLHGIL